MNKKVAVIFMLALMIVSVSASAYVLSGKTGLQKLKERIEIKKAWTNQTHFVPYYPSRNTSFPQASSVISAESSAPVKNYDPCGHLKKVVQNCQVQGKMCYGYIEAHLSCLSKNKKLDTCQKGCYKQRGWGTNALQRLHRGVQVDYQCYTKCSGLRSLNELE